MHILTQIVETRTKRLSLTKSNVPLAELKSRIPDMPGTVSFIEAIRRDKGPIRLIAEMKKASPSKGLIRKEFDPLRIAALYQEKPVDAISILTEEDYFQGSLSFIKAAKTVTTKPLLRKDFIIDEYQIYEARAHQADAILLIANILERGQAEEYLALALELSLSVLFEVHDEADLEKALLVDAPVIGINNRDLKSLKIDLATTFRLKSEIPERKIIVSESGIKNREDVLKLEDAGIDAMLIGTSLMRSQDIGAKIDELMRT